VGCRKRAAKTDLLRIAVVGDQCVADPRGTLPGRGAYLHPDMACFDLAVRRRAFPRAYRVQGPLGTTELHRCMEHAATQQETT
jgi:uncharacterized protein